MLKYLNDNYNKLIVHYLFIFYILSISYFNKKVIVLYKKYFSTKKIFRLIKLSYYFDT